MLAILFEVGEDDPRRMLVPTQEAFNDAGLDWTGSSEPFDDSTWSLVAAAPGGVGYDRAGGEYDPFIAENVESAMFSQVPTVFTRAAFGVVDAATVKQLKLRVRYDDGFIAWLNGQEVARANSPSVYPAWNEGASAEHDGTGPYEYLDLKQFLGLLRAGDNVLAIRGLNVAAADDDALLQFTLTGESEGPPTSYDDSVETLEGMATTIDVLANDVAGSDPIDPESVAIAAAPTNGTAVVNPDGTITYTPNGAYNGQDTFTYTVRDNTSTGQTTTQTLVASNAPVRALVPANDNLGTTWRGGNEPFNDAAWQAGTFGVGYDTNPSGYDYNPFLGLNVQSALQNVNTTVYMRSTFTIANPADVTALTLRMRYDDGFAAFINGVQVASAYAPDPLSFNSPAVGDTNGDANAVVFEDFNLAPFLSALQSGSNILAIHGLNQTLSSSDMLMQPELIATVELGGRQSNAATVTINVVGVDFPPVAVDDAYVFLPGTTVIAAPGVLANDADADGNPLVAMLASDVGHGTLSLDVDGSFTYTSAAGYLGTDSFTYRAFGGALDSNVATVTITVALSTTDFGDAPLPYSTTLAENGARHEAIGPMLGALRDTEGDGSHAAAADSDTDDDGVTFGSMRAGQLGATATVDVQNAPSGARLDAWIDFNADGSWGGPGEQIASGAPVVNGGNTIRFDVPSWAIDGQTFARFRLSTAGNVGVRGAAIDGEVEDYAVTILPPNAGGVFGGAHTITTTASGANSVFAADMDGDGDLDVLSASYADDKIAWYENDGSETFLPHTISTAADSAWSVFAADVDGDGDLDVLSASGNDNKVAWYENNGSEAFTAHTISTTADGPNIVFAADVDGDGDLDVLSASYSDDKIAWYENDGSQTFTAHTISNTADGALSVFAADLDGDGDLDVLSSSWRDDRIAWYENDGDQTFTAHTISTAADSARSVFAADMDGDGDLDVLSASRNDDKIAWYENDGSQTFTAHTISTAADLAGSVFAADMDGDGDIDVLSASFNDDKIAWYENDGSQVFATHTISTTANGPLSVFAADMDGDGDLDVLSASQNDDRIAWYENENPICASCADAYSADEDTPLVVDAAAGVLANDGAQVGEILTPSAVTAPSHGTLALATDGSFTYTPNADYFGADSFAYQVTSNQRGPRNATVTIAINPVSDAPVAVEDAYTAESGITLRATATVIVDPTPRDETLVPFNATWSYLHPTNGQDPAASDPDFNTTWQLGDAAYNGPAFNQGGAMLGYGTIDFGPIATDIGTPPSGSRYTAYFRRTFELTADPLTVTSLTAELLADDAAVIYLNGQQLALHNMPAGATGSYFDLAANFDVQGSSPESRTFTIVLDPAALVPGTNVLAVSVHNVLIDSSDLGFALRLDARIVPEPEIAGVLVNDSDADGDVLVAELVTPPANGLVTLNPDGTFEYTANAGFVGVDTFQYRASDGTLMSLPATATITVAPAMNRPPNVVDDAYAVDEDGMLSIGAATGVLANDSDPEQSPLMAAVVDQPQHGNLTFSADGSFQYTPYADYFGDDLFTYEASDGFDDSALATVTITVWPQPDGPVAVDDAYAIDEGQTLIVAAPPPMVVLEPVFDLWVRQSDPNTLYESDAMWVAAAGIYPELRHGAAEWDLSGVPRIVGAHMEFSARSPAVVPGVQVAYRIDDGIQGMTWNNYVATRAASEVLLDGLGHFATASAVPIGQYVAGINASMADVAVLNALRTSNERLAVLFKASSGAFEWHDGLNAGGPPYAEDLPIRLVLELDYNQGVLTNDIDADGDSLAAMLVTGPSHGSLSLAANGTFTYTPAAGFLGVDTFTYRASDGVNLSDLATVSITVNRVPALAEGLTGYWPFDGNGADLSGNARDLQLYGGVGFASGLFGQALDMNRNSSQYAARPESDAVFNFGAPTQSTLVDLNATWAYESSGTDLGTAWRESGFNDSGWARDTAPFSTVGTPTGSALSFSGAGATLDGPFAGYTLGWEFNVTTPITVASVGWFDSGAGLSASHPVGIFTSSGALLASATVVAGDPLLSSVSPQPGAGFRYHALASPLALGIGTYRIGGLNPPGSTDKNYDFVQSVTTIPQVSFVHSYYAPSGVLTFPNTFGDREKGYFGVNFQLAGGAPVLNLGPSTYYFRTTFPYTPADGTLELSLESLVDDGAIVYLNGVEVYRQNLPSGPVEYSTLAETAIGTASLGPSVTIPAASLAPGNNVLAVEVHQVTVADADAAFNARLKSTVTPLPSEVDLALGDVSESTFTIQEWVYFDTTSGEQVLIEKFDGDGGPGWTFTKLDNNALRFTGFNVADTPTLTIQTNRWHQFLIRKDDAKIDVYFNGVLVRSTADVGEEYFGASRPLLIGKRNDGDSRNLAVDGRIDQVAIWNRALSDAEIATLYNDGLGTTLNNCVSCADVYSADEDTPLIVDTAAGVLINDGTQVGEMLTASVVTSPSHGTLVLAANGSFLYTPNPNYFGADSFTYQIASNQRDPRNASATIAINSSPDVPAAGNDVYSTAAGQVLDVATLPGSASATLISAGSVWKYLDDGGNQGTAWREAGFNDAAWKSGPAVLGYGDGDEATVVDCGPAPGNECSAGNSPSNKYITTYFRRAFTIDDPMRVISLSLNLKRDDGAVVYLNGVEVVRDNLPSGTITFDTLAPDFAQDDGANFNPFPNINRNPLVRGQNVIAVEIHQQQQTSSDISFDLELTATIQIIRGVLANDTDADGDTLAAAPVAGPYHGALDFRSDGTFTYTPSTGFTGVDQFTYRASDATAASNLALVTINVGDDNEAPLGQEDRYITWGGRTLSVAGAAGLLANDFDANGDALTTTLFAPPTRGTLSLAADGSFTYTPQANFVGVDTFTYRVADDAGALGFATATIHVLRLRDPINGIPLAGDDTFDVTADAVLNVGAPGVLANDQDPELRPIVTAVERSPWHGSLSFAADGSFTYTPFSGFTGEDLFTYRASDRNTFSEPATVTIQVSAPIAPGGMVVPAGAGSTLTGSATTDSSGSITPDTLPTRGDLNGDGHVDRADVAIVVAAYGTATGTAQFVSAADMNGDGRVSLTDAMMLRNWMTGFAISYSSNALIQRAGDDLSDVQRRSEQFAAAKLRALDAAIRDESHTRRETMLRAARTNDRQRARAGAPDSGFTAHIDRALGDDSQNRLALVAGQVRVLASGKR